MKNNHIKIDCKVKGLLYIFVTKIKDHRCNGQPADRLISSGPSSTAIVSKDRDTCKKGNLETLRRLQIL